MRDVIVLGYHAVSPDWTADLSLAPEMLDRQVGFLLARGWRPVTFTDAATGTQAGRFLAVTFDDAFASVVRYAEPILTARGAIATVFAPTDFMDGGGPLCWPGVDHWAATDAAAEMRAMDWDDLRRLAAAGWEIGSHTCSHPRLTTLTDEDLRHELRASREVCARQLRTECRSVAFPYGDLDDRVVQAAKAAGYVAGARLSSHLRPAGAHAFPRVGIYHGDSWPRFRLKMALPMRRLRASALWPADRDRPVTA